jgi:hypothetical protein
MSALSASISRRLQRVVNVCSVMKAAMVQAARNALHSKQQLYLARQKDEIHIDCITLEPDQASTAAVSVSKRLD